MWKKEEKCYGLWMKGTCNNTMAYIFSLKKEKPSWLKLRGVYVHLCYFCLIYLFSGLEYPFLVSLLDVDSC